MAVPTAPTVSGVCTEGLKRGGRVNPSSTDITNAQNLQFQEVKADINLWADRHPSLITTGIVLTVIGQTRYSVPSTSNGILAVTLWDGPTDLQGTAVAGSATSLTLASSTSTKALQEMQGRFIILTGGTGSSQYGQITNWVPGTQVATVDSWNNGVTPDSTTTYMVANYQKRLFEFSKPYEWNALTAPYGVATPNYAYIQDDKIWLDYAPDKVYALLVDFWLDMMQLDEASSTFLNFLRTYQQVFIQGVAVKTAQRFDDTRYQAEKAIYDDMLNRLGSESGQSLRVTYRDV